MHVAEAEEQDEIDGDDDADGHEALEAVQEEEAEPGLDDDEEFQQLQSMLEVMATEVQQETWWSERQAQQEGDDMFRLWPSWTLARNLPRALCLSFPSR